MAKGKKILKIFGIIILVVIVLGGIGLAIVLKNINPIVKNGIEKVMSAVLDVEVTVEEVDVKLKDHSVTVSGLVIANPEGFKTEKAFSLDEAHVEVDIKSFRTEEPIIRLIHMDTPHVVLEQGFRRSNLTKLIDNAQKFQERMGLGGEKEVEEAEKYIKIDRIDVKNAKTSVSAPILQGKKLTITVPSITMTDLGGKKGKITIAESIEIFFKELLKGIARAGENILPTELLGNIGDLGGKALDDATDVGKGGVDVLKKTGGAVGDGVKDATDAIGGLFKKKDE